MDFITVNIPEELIALTQWVLWRYVEHPGEPKPRKVPQTVRGAPQALLEAFDDLHALDVAANCSGWSFW
jgi:hypothetical protein